MYSTQHYKISNVQFNNCFKHFQLPRQQLYAEPDPIDGHNGSENMPLLITILTPVTTIQGNHKL